MVRTLATDLHSTVMAIGLHLFFVIALLSTATSDRAAAQDRGEYLARAGDCMSCHTAPHGEPYAGGLRMRLPIGAVYTTNITPDRATGIGSWSFADFDRAVRRGIAKDGHHLYPAMPYPSFAKITDEDMHALYDYFMTGVTAVSYPNKPSDVPWPFDMRWPLAIWNWMFLDPTPFRPEQSRDPKWNRGAYLVETVAHCGACHTPRGLAWNELGMDHRDPQYLTGNLLEFWWAPNLRGDARTGLGRWSETDLIKFLRDAHNDYGASAGSMNFVTGNSMPFLTESDVAAIAAYLKSLSTYDPTQERYVYDDATRRALHTGTLATPGASLYLGYCERCHGEDGRGQLGKIPPLAGNPVVLASDSSSVVHIILDGGKALSPAYPNPPAMPPYRRLISDEQLASLVSFVRSAWGNNAPPIGTTEVGVIRTGSSPAPDQLARGETLFRKTGCGSCHSISGVPEATGEVGPPLDRIGSQTTIAGLLANNADNMASWLRWAQQIKPGDAMPNSGLSLSDAQDVTAYLETLR